MCVLLEGDMCSCPGGRVKYGSTERGGIWSSALPAENAKHFGYLHAAAGLSKQCIWLAADADGTEGRCIMLTSAVIEIA